MATNSTVHVIVPCRPDHARHPEFFNMLMALQIPGGEKNLYPGFFAHENRNKGIQTSIDKKYEYCFFVDDDQLLEPDSVLRLLAHDVDIVSCNLLTKEFPWTPFILEMIEGAGLLPLALGATRSLREVDAIGLGGVLVKTEVFKKLPQPWLYVNEKYKTDDLLFSVNAREAGYKIYFDPMVRSGHITKAVVWPFWGENSAEWETKICIDKRGEVVVKAATESPEFALWRDQQGPRK